MDVTTDTSVFIAVILNEPEKKSIINETAGHNLIGPGSIRWEITNAFSAMFKRGRISLKTAKKALKVFNVIPVRYIDVDFQHALKLSYDNNIYAYDAYFFDCALRHNTPILSLDNHMINRARKIGIDILEITT
ncbi:MAG: type II toxin-antitoxin system VapC family toxin [Candidatus Auribacterota bacterium]|nr:type II toxin-antitoxin system VapC family toxin [Candidatus Auribacterota bacterium]